MRATYREEPCRTALNRVQGMPFAWSLNPYMGCAHRCTFCYVRAFERRAERAAGEDYGRSIRVKTNIVAQLAHELARRSWRGEEVVIGAATDPYQPAEGRYRLTRGCLEQLAAAANPFALITRSPLVVRDRDVLARAAMRAAVSVTFSLPTLEERVWRATEPGTAPPAQRLRALALLAREGVRCSVAVAPILPGLSDRPEQLAAVVRAAREAGARGIWAGVLSLKPGTREHFLSSLAREWPELLPEYERLYARGAYLAAAQAQSLRAHVAALAREAQLGAAPDRLLRPPPAPRQLSLEL